MKRLHALSLLVLAVPGLAGCGREDEAAPPAEPPPNRARAGASHEHPPLVTTWPAPDAPATDRLEWNLRSLVGAYDTAGTKDRRWDVPARETLEAFAQMRARGDTNARAAMPGLVKRTLTAGCTDPMVTYLSLRYEHGDASDAGAEAAEAYRQAADALEKSGYPQVRKFYASLRAAQAWKTAHGRQEGSGNVYTPYRKAAFDHLLRVFQQADTPAGEALDGAEEFMKVVTANSSQEDEFLPTILNYLAARWPDEARALLLRSRAQVRLAWNRRGSGYADSVSKEGWQMFAEHLAGAERDLEHAWRLDPSNAGIAIAMMEVELGQGRGRPRLEMWFDRAMKADPASYEAAHAKAWYLQPKWHGSAEEAIAFGRECVNSKEWKGRVPLVLWEAHRMLANDKATGLKDKYWAKPGVWQDVQASFERFFELNPEATGWRHDYALEAHKCRQYDNFLDILPTMGWVRDSYFGGREAFDRMVAEAEKATGRKADVPKDRETVPAKN